ncbi:MAG: hypothetical protein ABIE42_04825 [Candidatus Eisenbacteria bacterium]
MNGRALLCALGAACLFVLPAPAFGGIDFEVTDVHVVWGGPYIYMEAEVTVAASGHHDGYIIDVGYEVDGSLVGTVQVDLGEINHTGVPSPRCVDSSSPCDGYCPPIVVDGQVVTAYMCSDWLDDPNCCCIYLIMIAPGDPVTYNGQSSASATVDYHDTVQETSETNNTMTVALEQPNIDFRVADCSVTWQGNEFTVEAEIEVSAQGEHSGFVTDVGFYFDGSYYGSVVFDADAFGPNPSIKCEDTYPACDGLCAPTIINGQLVNGSCSSWFFEDKCGCIYLVAKSPGPIQHTGQENCTIKVDDGNNVAEGNEENNVYQCAVAGTPAESATWGTIKALYR